ncbi:TMV resistance protein N-like [Ipomoea triloba]|uniref:TMV resistance protein N-like n=1 Tax=Ipomoea triloba TaxID=35885 RepID=UPI00125D2F60|nr:TMV resistance protein N-like [Ipomoea triloba]
MASITPSQSSSTRKFTYDVFLSFRGEDTRKNIVDHLYHWLKQKGLHTFKDDERLEKGQPIAPTLLQAIQESRFAVVVFSKTYASSTWCLDELAKIMECKEKLNQVVVPIFYNIDPSQVRKQTGRSFEEAFAKHEENFKDDEGKAKVERWRKALKEAGNISGHHLEGDEYNGFEIRCINAVIADISKQLPPPPSVHKSLVGLESRLEEITTKLKVWDEDVKLVLGLWGMGGIGKTTIARVTFDRFSSGFDGSCFLYDIRKHGLEASQEKLLSKVLKENSIHIDNAEEGIQMIQKRLEWKKVLIVLDDVDHRDQLDKLVGDGEWLRNGSRVIITTRDRHLFTQFSVIECYEVKKLEEEKALELFSWHAFKKENPKNGFEDLSTSFVAHAGGLPLALKVWGSSLCGQTDQKVWESKLEKIKGIRDGEVVEKLRISYDGLDEECKEVFLDIVCFFRGKRRDVIEEVLDGCKLNPVANISMLIDRCLLFEYDWHRIHMHDLIHELGLNIAREKRSRRWRLNHLDDEPKAVESLLLSFKCDENISLCIEAVKQMTKLKMLIVGYHKCDLCSSEEMDIMSCLPRSLVVLKFQSYRGPNPSFPMEMKKLTYLDLSSSDSLLNTPNFAKTPNLEMKNITLIDLRFCSSLLETPNFTMMPNLKYLYLSKCEKLKEIHPSIENLTKLVKLDFNKCRSLEKLPSFNQEMKNITHLELKSCSSLIETPDFALIPNLEYLNLSQCKKLKQIHPSIGNLMELVKLNLNKC